MAPNIQQDSSTREKRLHILLSFAAQLQERLPDAVDLKTNGTLLDDVETQIMTFPNKLGAAAVSKVREIDNKATELWNTSTRLRRQYEEADTKAMPVLILMTRVFAFLLLACAHEHGKSAPSNIVRLMKAGLKVSKNCLNSKQLDFALKVLEKVSVFEETLAKSPSIINEETESIHGLRAEYLILRAALAWRQDNMALAEHMYRRSVNSQQNISPHAAERLADVMYEMGTELLEKQQLEIACKWLERAYDTLVAQELDRLSVDASELRMAILNDWMKSLIGQQTPESLQKTGSLIAVVEDELGDKLFLLLLRLDLISAATDDTFDGDAYGNVLLRMTRSMPLNESNLKLLTQRIRKLNSKSPSHASKALDNLLKLRILQSGRDDWLEKVVNMRIWITVTQRDSMESLELLESSISMISASFKGPLSPGAAHSAQTLLWKRIESGYTQGQYNLTRRWCRLAMHSLFEKSGELNLARIARKLLLCAVAQNDLAEAQDTLGVMSNATKNEPLTRFLVFKLALQCDELDLAVECLEMISKNSQKDSTILMACVLNSQQVKNNVFALAALRTLLERHDYGAPDGVHLPTLLRITISLTVNMSDTIPVTDEERLEDISEKLCKLFEGGMASLRKQRLEIPRNENIWTVQELDWFSKNSYNYVVKHLSVWDVRHSIRLLVCCIAFIDSYPTDINEKISLDLKLRKMFCQFLAAVMLVVLARGEDVIQDQLQRYLELRKQVASFDSALQDSMNEIYEEPAQDLIQKLAIILAFDFEAACHLKSWDSLSEIVRKAALCQSVRVYEIMADCVMSIECPVQVMVSTLKNIINQIFDTEEMDVTKLTQYIRCLFQHTVAENQVIAEDLLHQAQNLAKDAAEACYTLAPETSN
ncbi:hypothetical protein BP6252_03345 [Coleophoma cylindrospora]|uniref:Protein ZIP4 homolog n=1 Tax=Coleophoma cylindrospora TaxID=1849047 RepID=A0A3D8S7G5_9HELO|nr:hypothetical protein BP6252_03345 [Coleophoma cylindrospora]